MRSSRSLLWIGNSWATLESQLTADETATLVTMRQAATVAAAMPPPTIDEPQPPPTFICLAESRPGQIGLAEVLSLSRRWPLARLISVETCLADGRRRSGPLLPGVTAVAWHDFPAKLRYWLGELAARRAGSLGLPITARRDERWLAGPTPVRRVRPSVTVAAKSAATAEAVGDLVTVAGGDVVAESVGRPPIADASACVVWDCGSRIDGEVGWLELLAGQQADRAIILLCSFPRGDAVQAARRAGAAAVLGRPVDLEALAGLLTSLETGLSPAAAPR